MADLPSERLEICPPFTYVGLDVFGPWSVTIKRTRGGQAESKRWAIMFSCMSSRAVHIEVIESMDTSSCINALRRFFALRGPAKQLRSDCGTNFVGASKELGMDKSVQRYLSEQGCSWEFNPPHASHMGGSWERMIGFARRILDSMLQQQNTRLTHEVPLHTNGGSHSDYECTPTLTCVYRSRETFHTFSVHDPHTEVGSYTSSWRLFRQGSVHKAMETSPGPRKPVLDPLEPRILTFLAAQTEVDSAPQKPSGWRSGSAQGQAGRSQQLAYGQSQCHIPWERWACKEGRSENN